MIIKSIIAGIGCGILLKIIASSHFRVGACSAWLDMANSHDIKNTTFEDSRTKERIKATIAEIILSMFIFYLMTKGA